MGGPVACPLELTANLLKFNVVHTGSQNAIENKTVIIFGNLHACAVGKQYVVTDQVARLGADLEGEVLKFEMTDSTTTTTSSTSATIVVDELSC